jgi:AcrR family transcriptional regulator
MQQNENAEKIDSVLRDLIAERGWSGVAMADIADRAGLDLAGLYRSASGKVSALIGALRRIDDQVLASGAADAGDTARDRLFEIMMRRYDALVPWRAALKRLSRELPFDPAAMLAVTLASQRSMARMLEAARLPAGGLGGPLRVSGLLTVHLAVLRAFVDDESPDLSATMKALDGRLKSIERWASMLDRYTSRPTPEPARPDTPVTNPVVDDVENANSQPIV